VLTFTPSNTDARRRTDLCRPLALVNPKSSACATHREFLPLIEEAGGVIHTTSSQQELARALVEAERGKYDRLVVVGGDGSVSRVVNAIGEDAADFELAVVPAGAGNDLARSLGIPVGDSAAAWDLALCGAAREVDAVSLRSDVYGYFVNGITAGFGGRQATLVDPEQKSYWGKIAYWLAALAKMGEMTEFDLLLTLDGQEQQIRSLGFWIANGRYVGGGFPVAPSALIDDGYLNLVVVPSLPTLDLLAAGVDFTWSGPDESDRILTFQATKIAAGIAPRVPLSVDGEPLEADALECHVLPGALKMVTGNVDPALGDVSSAGGET